MWLFVSCASFSWCHGFVSSVWVWYFLVILTYILGRNFGNVDRVWVPLSPSSTVRECLGANISGVSHAGSCNEQGTLCFNARSPSDYFRIQNVRKSEPTTIDWWWSWECISFFLFVLLLYAPSQQLAYGHGETVSLDQSTNRHGGRWRK